MRPKESADRPLADEREQTIEEVFSAENWDTRVLGFCVLIGFKAGLSDLLTFIRKRRSKRERERERERRGINSIAHHVLFLFFEESSGDIFVTQ